MIGTTNRILRLQLWNLAYLLDYPRDDYATKSAALCNEICSFCSGEAAHLLDMFSGEALQLSLDELEEVHTRTFSLAPLCPPYIGLQIFGENNFKRGDFIAMLAKDFERYELDIYPELPDYVGSMLRLAACQTAEELDEMLTWCFCDPVRKMAESMASTNSPYRHLLGAISIILDNHKKRAHADA